MSASIEPPASRARPRLLEPATWSGAWAVVVALTTGVVFSLAYPGPDQGWLAWVGLVPLWALLLTRQRFREFALVSFAWSLGFFGGLLHWFAAFHPLTWLGMSHLESLLVVGLAWTVLSGFLGLSAAVALTLVGLGFRRLPPGTDLRGARVAALVFAGWSALEVFQTVNPFGLTLGQVASTQYRFLPLLQGVRWVGSFPLGALIVAFNAALAHAWVTRRPRTVLAVAAVALTWVLAAAIAPGPDPGAALRVSVVQGNVSQTEKWSPGNEWRLLERYERLTREASQSDLVVWPESALPVVLLQTPAMLDRLADLARERRTALVTGTFIVEPPLAGGRPRIYNGTVGVGPDGRVLGWDAKKHLVPFGEYLPGRDTLPSWWSGFFARMNMLGQDLTPGDHPRIFSLPGAAVGSNVCFDSLFPDVMRRTAAAGAELLVLVTNDGWYGRSAALRQHLAQGVLRAVETGRPFIQAANTGASALVGASGRIEAEAPWAVEVALSGTVRTGGGTTPYVRWGDAPAIVMMLLAAVLAFFKPGRRHA